MTDKEKLIQEMHKKARAITGKNSNKWTREAEDELWTLASDNDVFMCEYQSDDSEYVNGFMIEDDFYIVEA